MPSVEVVAVARIPFNSDVPLAEKESPLVLANKISIGHLPAVSRDEYESSTLACGSISSASQIGITERCGNSCSVLLRPRGDGIGRLFHRALAVTTR